MQDALRIGNADHASRRGNFRLPLSAASPCRKTGEKRVLPAVRRLLPALHALCEAKIVPAMNKTF
jgi:hypothetical protein